MIVLAAIVAVTSVIFLVALKRPSTQAPLLSTTSPTTTPSSSSIQTTPDTSSTKHTKKHTATHKQFTVVLTASQRCWVAIHSGSTTGKAVLSTHGTDLSGYPIDPTVDGTVTFTSKQPVYMQVGAPGSLTVTINGKAAPLPQGSAALATIRVTSTGLTPA